MRTQIMPGLAVELSEPDWRARALALLAVAKATAGIHMESGAGMDGPYDAWAGVGPALGALRALDVAQPGWREWK